MAMAVFGVHMAEDELQGSQSLFWLGRANS
jgi:hypothetical protein